MYQIFLLYMQNRQCNEIIKNCRGNTAVVLPTGCPCSAGFLAGVCWKKVKVSAIPRGLRAWLQMTGVLLTTALLESAKGLEWR